MKRREPPKIIKEVGFDFSWDERKVWEIGVPVEEMGVDELTWHLDIPFLWSKPDGYYDIEPRWVLECPEKYPQEYKRTERADITYPIDIMWWRGRWVILDGLHRLMKQYSEGKVGVNVRKIPETSISLIIKK